MLGSHDPSGGPAEASPTWLSKAIDAEDVHMAPLRYVFMSGEDEEEVFGADDADAPLDVGDVILSDTLLDDDDCDEGRDLQDTSDITCKDGSIVFPCLISGFERKMDDGLIRELNSLRLPPSLGPHDSNRVIGPFVFDKTDIGRLDSPKALLNDTCINGLAYYLQAMISNDQRHQTSSAECAIFSTHDLVRIRYKASDQDLWRAISRTEFWRASTWIIPIHRPRESHWVLAVVYPHKGMVHVYDSLASKRGWPQDLEDILVLIQ
ncbi:hypothetical protein CVT26_004197 [Gymnopilus dilepis]|uniref:Ubiquitin-like protease family profile domain-containing protein n=1 Tax=Gymnopilus dilepis TaxID=231916 RepID=A0A409YMJ6_9AGAR|nr:hypothetical protein CVT26_004197 [Gymnopilus dilepis]